MGPKVTGIKRQLIEKIGDIKRGHTLQEEADVRRILRDPANISPLDIENYNAETIEIASFLIFLGQIEGAVKLVETGRDSKTRIAEDAKLKAKEWKLNLDA